MKKKIIKLFAFLNLLITFCVSTNALEVYFLDVGQGSAAVLQSDGYTMMIDGGPRDASQYVYSILQKHKIDRIDYMVATHFDEDHVGGLPAAMKQAKVGIVFGVNTDPEFSSLQKYLDEQKIRIVVPNIGDTFTLGNARVTILGPKKGMKSSGNTSLCLRVDYGSTSFLFVGDSEVEDENALIANKVDLESTVLVVGHHGSASSTADRFLKKVKPKYAIISVGADNTYGHPKKSVLDRLSKMGVQTYRTDLNGQIICTSDGKTVTFITEKSDGFVSADDFASGTKELGGNTSRSNPVPTPIIDDENVTYVGNASTRKFHYPTCKSVASMKSKNKVPLYGSREDAIADGYQPCGSCKP